MNLSVIRALLRARLLTVPDLLLVQWEAVAFTQPATETYLDDDLRGGTNATQSSGTTQTRPLYVLTIHTPPERILADGDRLVDAIGAAFEPGRTLTDAARTHWLEITTLDMGALRVLPSGWGYRRLAVGLTAAAFRTTLQTA